MIIVPLYIDLPRKTKKDKRCYFNLNSYRNRHHFISNQIKKEFKTLIEPQVEKLKFNKEIVVIYQVYYPDKKRRDKGNIYSIIQKFFLDALVECGCIEDDNDNIVGDEYFKKPIYDKGNGRVEIEIIEP